MAGPWFTVQESGEAFQPLAQIWLSDGERDGKARVEIKLRLEDSDA